MFEDVLVATDGSELAFKAVTTAVEMAKRFDSKIVIVCAFEPIPRYVGEPYFTENVERATSWADEVIDRTTESLGETGLDVETTVIEGPAWEAILNVAANRGTDLIVMGARGVGQLSGLLLGSVSQKVVQNAKCPVLIVK